MKEDRKNIILQSLASLLEERNLSKVTTSLLAEKSKITEAALYRHFPSKRAIYAGGVQFPPVHIDNQTFLPSQANNLYIFPAVGMAVYATKAKRVTDEMFIEAAHGVAEQVSQKQLELGMLFPPQSNILEVEIKTAAKVAKLIFEKDLAGVSRQQDYEEFIRNHVFNAVYANIESE